MQSSIFAKWVRGHPIETHLVLPGVMILLLIGMYFSGSLFLQNIVAPTMKDLSSYSWREFGALEMLQNFFLLCVIFYSLRCFMATREFGAKLFTFLLIIAMVFVFLEEIDYGRHLIEYFTGQTGLLAQDTWDRNLHSKTISSGEQVGDYIKLAASIVILLGFVVAPLFLGHSRNRTIRLLVPSKWFIATVILVIVLSRLAHGLEDAGHSIIEGTSGNLDNNTSEFRELGMYYLFLLYTAVLHERIIARQ